MYSRLRAKLKMSSSLTEPGAGGLGGPPGIGPAAPGVGAPGATACCALADGIKKPLRPSAESAAMDWRRDIRKSCMGLSYKGPLRRRYMCRRARTASERLAG